MPGAGLDEFSQRPPGGDNSHPQEIACAHFGYKPPISLSTADVKRLYASASIVSSDEVVFNIKGNAYRLVVAVDFEKGIVWIKWLGTHRDYDRIKVMEVNLG